MNYEELIDLIVAKLKDKKEKEYPNSVMIVGVEGICCSGKSTLVNKLKEKDSQIQIIEGDLFHRGRAVVHSLYQDIINLLDVGYLDSCNFHHVLTWKTEAIQKEILNQIRLFNNQDLYENLIVLHQVLKNKENGTEHDLEIPLTKKSIVVIPLVFLRHFSGIHFLINLEIDSSTSILRKINRTKELNINRDMTLTKEIITKLEYPTYLFFQNNITRKPDLTIYSNNWEDLKIKEY